MKKAVIFDMDGLMFETEHAYSLVHEKMFEKRGLIFDLELKNKIMGKRSDEIMNIFAQLFNEIGKEKDILEEQDGDLIEFYKNKVEPTKGLIEFLSFLNTNKIKKSIGTSSRRKLVDILLKKFNLENEFEIIVTSEDVTKGKPDPEIYNKVLEKTNLRGEDCLVLEDSSNGIMSAKSANCFAVAIPSEFTKDSDFSKSDLICADLSDNKIKEIILN